MLPAHLADSSDYQNRCKRETQTIAQLDRPNILSIIGFGQEADGFAYFITKFAKHSSWAARSRQPITVPLLAHFIEKIDR
jgi:hypothetical protein